MILMQLFIRYLILNLRINVIISALVTSVGEMSRLEGNLIHNREKLTYDHRHKV